MGPHRFQLNLAADPLIDCVKIIYSGGRDVSPSIDSSSFAVRRFNRHCHLLIGLQRRDASPRAGAEQQQSTSSPGPTTTTARLSATRSTTARITARRATNSSALARRTEAAATIQRLSTATRVESAMLPAHARVAHQSARARIPAVSVHGYARRSSIDVCDGCRYRIVHKDA